MNIDPEYQEQFERQKQAAEANTVKTPIIEYNGVVAHSDMLFNKGAAFAAINLYNGVVALLSEMANDTDTARRRAVESYLYMAAESASKHVLAKIHVNDPDVFTGAAKHAAEKARADEEAFKRFGK